MNQSDYNLKNRFNNNFDFLRLLGAFLVIFSHSYPLTTGNSNSEILYSLTGGFSFGALGVAIFFVISGYLITASWLKRPYFSVFFWNRILRIVPGLFVVATLTIFIIGPLVTTLPLTEYFKNPMTLNYYKIILIYFPNQYLPGVFVNNIFPNTINGSLWILVSLFTMYIIVFIIGIFGFFSKKKIVILITLIMALAFISNSNSFFGFIQSFLESIYFNKFEGLLSLNVSPAAAFFMIGVSYYLYKDFVKYDMKIAIFLFLLWVLSFKTPVFLLVTLIAIPYIILFIAFLKVPILNNMGKYGDFSYGLYIYAFPIQQTLYYFMNSITAIEMFLITSIILTPISFLSYKFVESKALKLKKIEIHKVINNKLK